MFVTKISASDIRPLWLPDVDLILHCGDAPEQVIMMSIAQAEDIIRDLQGVLAEIKAKPNVEIVNFTDQASRK